MYLLDHDFVNNTTPTIMFYLFKPLTKLQKIRLVLTMQQSSYLLEN